MEGFRRVRARGRDFGQALLTLSLWKGLRKLPPISPSSRGVPGGLFMPAMLLGEFWGIEVINKI